MNSRKKKKSGLKNGSKRTRFPGGPKTSKKTVLSVRLKKKRFGGRGVYVEGNLGTWGGSRSRKIRKKDFGLARQTRA